MKKRVEIYLELAPGAVLTPATTPFLQEDQRDSPARGPSGNGPVEECPWCCHTFPPNPYSSISELERAKKAQQRGRGTSAAPVVDSPAGVGDASVAKGSGGNKGQGEDEEKWRLAPVAAKILMKIIYGARNARLDLLRAVSHLACFFNGRSNVTSGCIN